MYWRYGCCDDELDTGTSRSSATQFLSETKTINEEGVSLGDGHEAEDNRNFAVYSGCTTGLQNLLSLEHIQTRVRRDGINGYP